MGELFSLSVPNREKVMTIRKAFLRALGVIVILPGFLLTAFSVGATPIFSLSAELLDSDGNIVQSSSGELPFGGPRNTLMVETNTVESGRYARVEGTYDKTLIKNYVAGLAPSDQLDVVGDTRWIAKIGADVKLQSFYLMGGIGIACCDRLHLGPGR